MKMAKFHRIASVEFKTFGEDVNVTVSNIPYTWNGKGEIEGDAVYKAIAFLRRTGMTRGLDVVSITTSPAKEEEKL